MATNTHSLALSKEAYESRDALFTSVPETSAAKATDVTQFTEYTHPNQEASRCRDLWRRCCPFNP